MTDTDETDDSEPETTTNPFDDADREMIFNADYEETDESKIYRGVPEEKDEGTEDSDN
jgi:hypothetical protein